MKIDVNKVRITNKIIHICLKRKKCYLEKIETKVVFVFFYSMLNITFFELDVE